jgi:hypothetical protein
LVERNSHGTRAATWSINAHAELARAWICQPSDAEGWSELVEASLKLRHLRRSYGRRNSRRSKTNVNRACEAHADLDRASAEDGA